MMPLSHFVHWLPAEVLLQIQKEEPLAGRVSVVLSTLNVRRCHETSLGNEFPPLILRVILLFLLHVR